MFTELVSAQRSFFLSGGTIDIEKRKKLLRDLKTVVKEHEESILDALKLDLGKPRFEAYVSELAHFYTEVDYAVSHLKRWSKRREGLHHW